MHNYIGGCCSRKTSEANNRDPAAPRVGHERIRRLFHVLIIFADVLSGAPRLKSSWEVRITYQFRLTYLFVFWLYVIILNCGPFCVTGCTYCEFIPLESSRTLIDVFARLTPFHVVAMNHRDLPRGALWFIAGGVNPWVIHYSWPIHPLS